MNWLDIVIILLLLTALWQGWRQGVITQILGLAALALGIWLAWRWGGAIGGWLGIEQGATARVVGFIIVLVVVIVAVVLLGRLTRGLFRIVGLGVFDNLLGAAFSALKMALFIGLVIMVIGYFDPGSRLISEGTRGGSVMFRAVDGVCDAVFPFIREMFRSL
jgi:membrane protein required for colicin V production